MAQKIASPAGEEIQIAVAFGVPHVRSLAARQANGIARIVADHIFLKELDDLLRGVHFLVRGQGAGAGAQLVLTTDYYLLANYNFGSYAAIGVNFQEHGVSNPAVDHVRLANASPQTFQTSFHLGNHALINNAA